MKAAGIVTLFSPVQPEKAQGSISVTPAGIVIETSDEQFAKEYAPIDLSVEGRVISESLEHFQKACASIVSRPSAMVTFSRFGKFVNTFCETILAEEGMITSLTPAASFFTRVA